jgi:hypothetical protein
LRVPCAQAISTGASTVALTGNRSQ